MQSEAPTTYPSTAADVAPGGRWPWRELARCLIDPDQAGAILRTLAAGFSLGLFAWEATHAALLEGYLLTNEIAAAERAALLRTILAGTALTLLVWLVGTLVLASRGRDVAMTLRRGANLLFLAVCLPFLPILALPQFETQYAVLDLCLVSMLGALALVHGQQLACDWGRSSNSKDTHGLGVTLSGLAPNHPWPRAFSDTCAALRCNAAQCRRGSLRAERGGDASLEARRNRLGADHPLSMTGVGHIWNSWGPSRAWGKLAAAPWGLIIAAVLGLGYVAFFGAFTVAKHNAFGTHSFDLGIFDQGLYTILHHGVMLSTQHGAQTISHFGRHFSPILYLLAPLYAFWQDARMLLIIQSLFLGLGALPLYLLAREKTGSQRAAVLLSASYLLYPALHGVNNFDFSEIALVPSLLLFTLYFLETRRDLWFGVFLLLAVITKEEVAMSGVVIGAYIFLAHKRLKLGALVAALCLVYFVLVNKVLMPAFGHGPLVDVFASIMPAGDVSFSGLLTTFVTNPVYAFKYIFFDPEKLLYLWQLLLPVLFLPLLSWRAGYLALPALAVPLLSPFQAHHQIGYQYPATSVAFIFFLAILAIRDLQARRWNVTGLAAAVLVVSLVMNYQFGLLFAKSYNGLPQPSAHQEILAGLIAQVPKDASVSAMSDIVPHLSSRDRIYLFPIVNDADYLLLDSEISANFWPYSGLGARGKMQEQAVPYLLSGAYGLVKAEDGCLLLKRGHDTAGNRDALRMLFSAKYEAESLRSDYPPSDLPDAQASGGKARVVQPNLTHAEGKDGLTWGPYDTLFPGKYRITYWMKLEGPALGKVATVDVFSTAAGGPLAGADVQATDLQGEGFRPVTVDLEIGKGYQDVEYRVMYGGKGTLAVDYIQVEPLRLIWPATGQDVNLEK